MTDTPSQQPPLTYAEKLVDLQQQPLNEEERENAARTLATQEWQAKFAADKINRVELKYETEKLQHKSYKDLIVDEQRVAKEIRHKALDGQRWKGEITQAKWREEKLETANMSLDALNKDASNRSRTPGGPDHTHGHTIER